MIYNNILGLIFSNMHDESVSELTQVRTMGSILFGGRYRLIDFPLSNMTNSGIPEVGVVTKSNYQSLLDHIGSGREWDLCTKNGGIHLLPPFSHHKSGLYRGRIEAIEGILPFIQHSNAEYVVMADCDVVTTIDFRQVIREHMKNDADITVVYAKHNFTNNGIGSTASTILEVDDEKRVISATINPDILGEANRSLNMFVIGRRILEKIVSRYAPEGFASFDKQVLQQNKANYRICGYEHKGYYEKIEDIMSYYNANMNLLNPENMQKMFLNNTPIYTKVKDSGPAKYEAGSVVRNSLIADGCVIEGEVINSVLFRGVKVGKGAVVRNCILMQNTQIGEDAELHAVITDKNVRVGRNKLLTASTKNALFIKKNQKIEDD
ncbi:MAG: glucose-1-phosphate adenylyltransferase subunit GlgD [Oscillospiraceae bacterium]|nr:glucose-1-phosphate adenylyltransferase subunit GlgD [Oscillospiraceae bacterium]